MGWKERLSQKGCIITDIDQLKVGDLISWSNTDKPHIKRYTYIVEIYFIDKISGTYHEIHGKYFDSIDDANKHKRANSGLGIVRFEGKIITKYRV